MYVCVVFTKRHNVGDVVCVYRTCVRTSLMFPVDIRWRTCPYCHTRTLLILKKQERDDEMSIEEEIGEDDCGVWVV